MENVVLKIVAAATHTLVQLVEMNYPNTTLLVNVLHGQEPTALFAPVP